MKEAPFWKRMKSFDNMFEDGAMRSDAGHRYRTVKVNTVEAARWIFEAANNLSNIEWATLDIGPNTDPLDPDNWEDM